MPRLFVYGTLRTPIGGPAADTHYHERIAAHIVDRAGARISGAELVDFGPYPGLVAGDGVVVGEVFDLDDAGLVVADEIEGHPDFYVRRLETVEVALDGSSEAWVYWAPPDIVPGRPRIVGGDWLNRKRGGTPGDVPALPLDDDPAGW